MSTVRCRIAPSPSGFLHIGTAKIALFNWLFARTTGGTFVLRLEDTDAERTEEQFVQAMCEGFHWLGIHWDEGPDFGDEKQRGDLGPYRQSLRKDVHKAAAQRLVDEGKAYKCFCTRETLAEKRERAQAEGRPPRYDGTCRDLTPEQIEAQGDAQFVIRFKVPEGETTVKDLVQGDITTKHENIDDFVIIKPNGDPIFHLAVVVDDGDMQISHVIRGDDHLTNTVRHQLLFEALGYPVPEFAHLPMVLDERGKKYSKREHGANVLDWRDDGYLAETLTNYVALLGWTPEEAGRELFTLEELAEIFRIDRWGKSPAKFDRKKLDWLNGQHLRRLSVEDLRDRLIPRLEEAGFDVRGKSEEWLNAMTEMCQEKLATLNQVVTYTDFFFQDVAEYEEKAVKKQWRKEGALEKMEAIRGAIAEAEPWSHEALKTRYEALATEREVGLGQFIHPTRLALTGKAIGPGLFELAELLGRDTCLARMDRGIEHVKQIMAETEA